MGTMVEAFDDLKSGDGQVEASPRTSFGKYQLFASLGRGGMADVFLSVARGQMGFNKLAVVKRLRAGLAEDPAFRQMFLDEARLAARLSHPNVVHTYEVGEQDGVYFIAMEYLEGQSLNKVVKEAARKDVRLDPAISARIVADALAGLGHAHDLRDYDGKPLGIIHRDVSPHNIFVTYDGHTKLVDFGVAKAKLSSTETEVGVLKGKISYMSPEQAMGAPLDGRADLFAMGIVLWELLTQQRLMGGDNAANTLHRLINEPIPPISQMVSDVDPRLERICERALEKDPARRWPNASAMKEELESWLVSRPWPVNQDLVSRQMIALFEKTREEVQRHVQKHMALLTAAGSTEELRALTAESIRRLGEGGANVSGQLLKLGPGSGSGVVPNYTMSAPEAESSTSPTVNRQARLAVLAVGFFALAAMLVGLFVFREGGERTAPETNGKPVGTQVSPPVAESTAIVAPYVAQAVTPGADVTASIDPSSASSAAPEHEHVETKPAPPSSTPSGASNRKSSASKASTGGGGKASSAAATSEGGSGFLTLNATPWAKVSERGKILCTTPCFKVALPTGSHTLVLENPDEGLRQTTTVVITKGEVTTRSLALK